MRQYIKTGEFWLVVVLALFFSYQAVQATTPKPKTIDVVQESTEARACSQNGWALGRFHADGDSIHSTLEGPISVWFDEGYEDEAGRVWAFDGEQYTTDRSITLFVDTVSVDLWQVEEYCGFASEADASGDRVVFGNELKLSGHNHRAILQYGHAPEHSASYGQR